MGKRIANETFLVLVVMLCVLPVVLIFLTAFKPDGEIIHFRGLLPEHWTLFNFRQILTEPEEIPIFRWLGNSLLISGSITVLVLVVDSMAAYALARLNLPGGRGIFATIIATLIVPGQILLVPIYLNLSKLHWIDTPLALIVPAGARRVRGFLIAPIFQSRSEGIGRSRGIGWLLAIGNLLAHHAPPLPPCAWRHWLSLHLSGRGMTFSARWFFSIRSIVIRCRLGWRCFRAAMRRNMG